MRRNFPAVNAASATRTTGAFRRHAYRKLAADPEGAGLRFKKVNDDPLVYPARISERLRVLGHRQGDTIAWFWIGYHDEYDRIIRGL